MPTEEVKDFTRICLGCDIARVLQDIATMWDEDRDIFNKAFLYAATKVEKGSCADELLSLLVDFYAIDLED